MQMNLESVLNYVESVPIIEMPAFDALESGSLESQPVSPTYNEEDQAVTIGSQITEFARSVPARQRPQISNALLLAQLAANKAVENGGSTTGWYKKYVEVLANIGWLVEGDVETLHNITGTGLQVHNAIIPVITAALGGAAAATLIVPLLKGLEKMSEDSPWITLLDRESKRVKANQFQICHVSAGEAAAPKLMLVCFGLDASHSVTQVLFFKFSSTDAILSHSQADLSVDTAILDGSREMIQAKVAQYLSSYISDIEI